MGQKYTAVNLYLWWSYPGVYMYTSCKCSVARRVIVLLTPRILVIMFVILSKESFKKKTVCYSIKQRSNSCCCKKKQTLQCNGLTSKHSNSFFVVFYCLTSIFFVLFLWDNFWFFYHFSELSNFKKKTTFHGNIYTNGKVKPFSNKIYNYYLIFP